MVALEKRGTSGDYLTHPRGISIIDADFGLGNGFPDRIKIYVPVPMNAGNSRNFGLAIDLLEIHAQSVKEAENIRAQGGTTGRSAT